MIGSELHSLAQARKEPLGLEPGIPGMLTPAKEVTFKSPNLGGTCL